MNYSAEITIDENIDELFDCLKIENINRERSDLKIKKTKEKLFLNITAKDATALRATFDGIIKLIITFEKMKSVQ